MEDIEIVKLVARHFATLKKLYPNRECYLAELAGEVKKDMGNLSKQIEKLEEKGLIATREGPRSEGGRPFKYCRLTERGREILAVYVEPKRPEVKELPEADPKLVNFVIEILETSQSEETLELALKDLRNLSVGTRVWKHKDVLRFLEKTLANKARKKYFCDALSDLLAIVKNASEKGEKKIVAQIKRTFAGKIKELASSAQTDIDLRDIAVKVLEAILPSDEKWDVFTKLLEEKMRKVEDEGIYSSFAHCLLSYFREHGRGREMELRRWFYRLTSDGDERVRKRALDFYRTCSF